MSRRLTNALLMASTALLVASGVAGWVLPEALALPLYPLHRVAGVGLMLGLVWKYGIAAGSVRRRIGRDASIVAGLAAAGAVALCLALGVMWSLGAVSFDRPIPYSPLNLHVFAGLALLPLLAWHALLRAGPRNGGALVSRRDALRFLAVGGVAAAFVRASDLVAPARRPTGSRHSRSFSGNDFPVTIWQLDEVPEVDVRSWSLAVTGAVGSVRVTYDDLAALGTAELDAVIDCTGGWWSEQRWKGAPVAALLAGQRVEGGQRVRVVSVTGHGWEFSAQEVSDALLATHVGGEPLTPDHGYPVRLVVPGRRGFQWVKWVSRIEVA
ncbi:hypothetical protein BH18CHL2_BH18CHL2_07280 [soil metagenome]